MHGIPKTHFKMKNTVAFLPENVGVKGTQEVCDSTKGCLNFRRELSTESLASGIWGSDIEGSYSLTPTRTLTVVALGDPVPRRALTGGRDPAGP